MSSIPPAMGRDVVRYVRLDLEEVEELHIAGRTPAVGHLRGPHGNIRAGALLTMIDSAGGLCGGLAALPDGWVVSTNLCARTVAVATGPLRVDARVLRKGRNNVVTSVEIHDDETGRLVMDGVLTSTILVPENGPPQWERPLRLSSADRTVDHVPMQEWLGSRVVDDTRIEIDLTDGLRNPWGILHGGVSASLVDACAEHAVGGITTDVVLHFLAPNRLGPVRATATVLGTRSDGSVVRVELRDEGADRVTAVAVTTVRLASSS